MGSVVYDFLMHFSDMRWTPAEGNSTFEGQTGKVTSNLYGFTNIKTYFMECFNKNMPVIDLTLKVCH